MSSSTARMSRLRTTGLLALCVIPALAGVVRLTELATGAEITPDNPRFIESPVPVVLHIVSVITYTVLGVFQFAPRCGASGSAGTGLPGESWSRPVS